MSTTACGGDLLLANPKRGVDPDVWSHVVSYLTTGTVTGAFGVPQGVSHSVAHQEGGVEFGLCVAATHQRYACPGEWEGANSM